MVEDQMKIETEDRGSSRRRKKKLKKEQELIRQGEGDQAQDRSSLAAGE